jgi:hypothetical protein
MNATDQKYWFRAKRYGWGWGLPITWQGWAVFIAWLIVFSSGVYYFAARRSLLHLAFAAVMVSLLMVICYWKGEPPRWRFGNRD